MFSSNLNNCIASTHHFRIVFILFSWSLFPKMHWMSLKGNALKVMTEMAHPLSSSRCYAGKLNSDFGLSLSIQTSLTDNLNRGEFKHICPKLLFLCYQFNMLKNHGQAFSVIKFIFSMKYFRLEQQAHF